MSTNVPNPNPTDTRFKRFLRANRVPLISFGGLLVVAAIVIPFILSRASNHSAASYHAVAHDYGLAQSANSSSGSSATSMSSGASTSSGATAATSSAGASRAGRDVIETASLQLSVKNVSQAADTLTQMTNGAGGFVASMQSSSTTDGSSAPTVTSTDMTLRVPETKLQNFIKGAKGLGQLRNFSQSGQDATDEHQSLSAKLDELNSESKAYTRLYDKAQSMKDMLQIQQSLSQVQSQIDQTETQLHQLNQSISLATLHVTLSSGVESLPRANMSTVSALSSSLHFMKVSLHALLIFLAFVLPWAALLAIILYVVKLAKKRKKR